jgi:hypothetical protein
MVMYLRYVSHSKPVLPTSLYIQQLKERLGDEADSILSQIFFPSQLSCPKQRTIVPGSLRSQHTSRPRA